MWEPKYGVVSAKFVIHQVGEAARVKNYPFHPWAFEFAIFGKGIECLE
jgi:hypothetical protein